MMLLMVHAIILPNIMHVCIILMQDAGSSIVAFSLHCCKCSTL